MHYNIKTAINADISDNKHSIHKKCISNCVTLVGKLVYDHLLFLNRCIILDTTKYSTSLPVASITAAFIQSLQPGLVPPGFEVLHNRTQPIGNKSVGLQFLTHLLAWPLLNSHASSYLLQRKSHLTPLLIGLLLHWSCPLKGLLLCY